MPRRKNKASCSGMSSSEERNTENEESSICSFPKKRKQCEEESFDSQFPCSLLIRVTQSKHSFKLGDFTLRLFNVNESLTSEYIFLRYGADLPHCLLCWKDIIKENEIQVKFYDAVCDMPLEVLQSLQIKVFDVILESSPVQSGEVTFHVYINPTSGFSQSYAAQPYVNRTRKNVNNVLKHFLAVDYEVYHSDFIEDEGHIDKIYKSIRNCYDPDKRFPLHPKYLIPNLRDYQIQAVKWMLKREKAVEMHTPCLHILYDELNLCDGSKIYFQKYGGFFVNRRYESEVPCRGGILADEMGLGKTVEVLACILLNSRSESMDNSENQNFEYMQSKLHSENRNFFSSMNNSTELPIEDSNPSTAMLNRKGSINESERSHSICFECVCGESYNEQSDKTNVACQNCGLIQHAHCVLHEFDGCFDHYICPYCCISSKNLVQSKATLIVSPSAILYQWEREIFNHIKANKLKVFTYLGVSHHKFINPSVFAGYDIILTSYEIFKKEFKHVNVPHGASRKNLRYPKKFTFIPSPLSAVEWWRICLDEGQMVESVTTQIAKMSLHLHAVNRWCVTGTPIQKSVEDLYGLLLFLGYDPYNEHVWWKEALLKPFANGKPANIVCVLNQILWRTAKKDVIIQIGIPHQKCIVHTTYLTRVEKLFYQNLHGDCKIDFNELLRKYDCAGASLQSMDKQVVSKIMLPLKKLRQACSHFQLVWNNFADMQKGKLTLEELLCHMMKSSSIDCEEAHRKLIMAMNGLAGMLCIKKDFKNACNIYKNVLISVEENQGSIRTDTLQQVHTLHNFSRIISEWKTNHSASTSSETFIPEDIDLNPESMTKHKDKLINSYLMKYQSAVENIKIHGNALTSEINNIKSTFQFGSQSAWYCHMYQSLSGMDQVNFLFRVKELLVNAPGVNFGGPSIANKFNGPESFMFALTNLSRELDKAREALLVAVHAMPCCPTPSDLDVAVVCHLRENKSYIIKCIYCQVDVYFQKYESRLFRFEETVDGNRTHADEICFASLKRGTHAASDLEIILKEFLIFSRQQLNLRKFTKDARTSLKLLDSMKKEFKFLRKYWINVMDYVGAVDEIEQAMTPLKVFNGIDAFPYRCKPSHLVLPSAIQSTLIQFKSDVLSAKEEMQNKIGQLKYLQNLKDNKNDEMFEDPCPICHSKMESPLSMLMCGHAFCLECIQTLRKFVNEPGRYGIPCPVCRRVVLTKDIFSVEKHSSSFNDGEFNIQGYFSSKTFSVVKCLLTIRRDDPHAKSIVFSCWTDFLQILECALRENRIPYIGLFDKKDFQLKLESFKLDPCMNVLLLPLNVGANGLNIIEATHVLITEPVLDNSKFLQAIGRIHRIGQTKPTFVHRFVVMGTIEEKLYEILESKSPVSGNMESAFTMMDLRSFFEAT